MVRALKADHRDRAASEGIQQHFYVTAGAPLGTRHLAFHNLPVVYEDDTYYVKNDPNQPTAFTEVASPRDDAESLVRMEIYAVSDREDRLKCSIYVLANDEYRSLFASTPEDPEPGEVIEVGNVNRLTLTQSPQKRKGK